MKLEGILNQGHSPETALKKGSFLGFKYHQLLSINILKKGLNTVGHTGIKAWGENDRCLSQATGSDKLAR